MSFKQKLHDFFTFPLRTSLSPYALPEPTSNEERNRLNTQHDGLKLGLKLATGTALYTGADVVERALRPERGKRKAILDVGTGSGIWAIEMAQRFPHADVVGMDLTPPKPESLGSVPPNCRFIRHNANDDMGEFTEMFDVVHMRMIIYGTKDYEKLLRNTAQVLKPGGVLLLMGPNLQFMSDKLIPLPKVEEGQPGWTATQHIPHTFEQFMLANGGQIDAIWHWGRWLNESPYWANVREYDLDLPIGPWKTTSEDWREVGRLMQADAKEGMRCFVEAFPAGTPLREKGERWVQVSAQLSVDLRTRAQRIFDQIAVKEINGTRQRVLVRWHYSWAVRTTAQWNPDPAPEPSPSAAS
ncbi:hypothetical protein FRB99_004789 [Tulasnella sp. 403]|nr:hypothetical protein FRB99_004789 [Tulasnella sp. 403]